jgi:hypothetical protein
VPPEAARCANDQGVMGTHPDKLDLENLVADAASLKLDATVFRACVVSEKYKPDVQSDMMEAMRVGADGTPAFVIGRSTPEGVEGDLVVGAPQIASTCDNTPAWSPCELVLELSPAAAAAHPDPYSTVELRAEFRSPNMRTYLMPAFWDGGRRMVLRFSPTEAGRWEYRLTGNIAEWDGIKGEFAAAACDAPGFVKTANLHHWATADNRPHLWMGANEMRFARLEDADFRALVDARAAQKFNHLRGLVLAKARRCRFLGAGLPTSPNSSGSTGASRYINSKRA